MKIAVLLPTYNEEEEIGKILKDIKKLNNEIKSYVVDSGSKDKTVFIAKNTGASVIEISKRGKAMAVREALKKINEEYLVMMDSDGSYSIKDISLIIEKLKEADVVIGSRLKGSIERGAMAEINRIGNIFLSFLASLIYGKQISDVCSGMWGFRKKAYKQLDIKAKHFELEVDLFANCAKKNFKIIEVPITYKKRTGKTKLNPFVDGTKIAFHLIKRRFF